MKCVSVKGNTLHDAFGYLMPGQLSTTDSLVSAASAETAGWPSIRFPSNLVAGVVEKCLQDFHADRSVEPKYLCLDLSCSSYIEIASLQLLIACVAGRQRRSLETKLRLPGGAERVNARHFLRRWEFDEALKAACGRSFSSLVDHADHAYFAGSPAGGDVGDPYGRRAVIYNDKYGEVVLPKEAYRFFKFTSWRVSGRADKAAVIEQERQRWRDADQVVIETLRKNLRIASPDSSAPNALIKSDKFIVSRVMLQAITNALRHPNASVIQASSHMSHTTRPIPGATDKTKKRLVDHFFTMVYWDDGQPMYETLRAAISAGRRINYPSEMAASYLVQTGEDAGLYRAARIVDSTAIPSASTSDRDLLLSTLFPGVTCDIEGSNRIAFGGIGVDKLLELPGHGLSLMVQAVVDLMGGSIAFRTGGFFMNVSAISDVAWRRTSLDARKPAYRVTIKDMPPHLPRFLGNMLTVRLRLIPA